MVYDHSTGNQDIETVDRLPSLEMTVSDATGSSLLRLVALFRELVRRRSGLLGDRMVSDERRREVSIGEFGPSAPNDSIRVVDGSSLNGMPRPVKFV